MSGRAAELDVVKTQLEELNVERDQLLTENESLKGANGNLVSKNKGLEQQLKAAIDDKNALAAQKGQGAAEQSKLQDAVRLLCGYCGGVVVGWFVVFVVVDCELRSCPKRSLMQRTWRRRTSLSRPRTASWLLQRRSSTPRGAFCVWYVACMV